MALVRYNDLADFTPRTFSSLLDRFFNESVGNVTKVERFVPQVDVAETEKEFEISVAVPGMKKEDFKIDLKEDQLTISGQRKFEERKEGKNFHSVETQYGAFSRSFYLPDNINKESVDAHYQDGILRIVLPKDAKKVLVKEVKVK
jgi:HSP20 family protein